MGTDGLSVGEGQDGHLRPGEELLNDHPAAGHRRSGCRSIMERTASSASSRVWQMSTPLPRARPSALTTMGTGADWT